MVVKRNLDEFRVFVGDLRTGVIDAFLPVDRASLKWGIRLNNPGSVDVSVPVRAKQLQRLDLRTLTTTTKQMLGVAFGDEILECGPIGSRNYNIETESLELKALGIWDVFDRRKNVPGSSLLPGANVPKSKIDVYRGHLGSIARELVRISIQDNPYGGDLPIVLPDNIPGTDHERHYKGYNLGWLGEDLRELTAVEDGPDIRFRPRFVAGTNQVEWVMEHGEVDILQQKGPDWRWDASTPYTPLSRLGVEQNGHEVAAFTWAPGSGQEVAMRLATAKNLSLIQAGYPWTEAERSSNNEESLAVLQRVANRGIADTARPWDQWTVEVRADHRPYLGQYLPGDWAVVRTPENHPILPAGELTRVRIMAVDGDSSRSVKLTVAPIQGRTPAQAPALVTTGLHPAETLYPSETLHPSV